MATKPRHARLVAQTKSSAPAVKRYVLDTNVLLHDPTSLFRFEEHDVVLPMVVLEELDRHKKGVTDTARNARQIARTLDALLTLGNMTAGFPLDELSGGLATGRLYFRDVDAQALGIKTLEAGKADNLILGCAQVLLNAGDTAILVTKDINLRVKALAAGVPAQDFRSDRVLTDEDVLPTGFIEITDYFWTEHAAGRDAFFRRRDRNYARIAKRLPVNSFLVESSSRGRTRLWRVESNSRDGSVLYQLTHADKDKERKSMLEARNPQQSLALSLLYDPDVDLVAMLGQAGTGKTLLAVASGLEQVKMGLFNEVLITRATVPLGDEIGFLPGTEQEKMDPWIGGTLRDVYSVLGLTDQKDPLRQKVEVASMSFMRGRSFQGKYIIVDEAQNLSQNQMRALLTRAGEGCKVVLTGNLGQIDSPYIDEGSSGLSWAVKTVQDWPHAGHLILNRGERSRLATFIEEAAARGDDGGLEAA